MRQQDTTTSIINLFLINCNSLHLFNHLSELADFLLCYTVISNNNNGRGIWYKEDFKNKTFWKKRYPLVTHYEIRHRITIVQKIWLQMNLLVSRKQKIWKMESPKFIGTIKKIFWPYPAMARTSNISRILFYNQGNKIIITLLSNRCLVLPKNMKLWGIVEKERSPTVTQRKQLKKGIRRRNKLALKSR